MAKRINEMESQFIAGIKAGLTQQQAALNAGYSPKTAHTQASQLMRKPKIIAVLDEWKASKRSKITQDDYVDLALNDYKALELTEANKPRFLDIAGKALGYIGAGQQDNRPNQTLNITLQSGTDRDTLLANVRRLLADNSGNV